MIRPELLKEHWMHVSPKLREMFPKLTDQDVAEINGNLETLVTKVTEKHGLKREEILKKIAPLVPVPAEPVTTGQAKQ